MRSMLGVCCLVLFAAGSLAEEVSEFTRRVTAELREQNPMAADLFSRANAAREAEDWANAERLYAETVSLQPDFFHATRRQCGALLAQGRRDDAMTLCRQAMAAADTPENRSMLLSALTEIGEGETVPEHERTETVALARSLLSQPDLDPIMLPGVCQAALVVDEMQLFSTCADRLRRDSPEEISTHYFAWVEAMIGEDHDAAIAALDRARELGLPEDAYVRMHEATEEARPIAPRILKVAGVVLAVWLGALLVLLIAGALLSRYTLDAARQVPTTRSGESVGLAGTLRKSYQAVLWLTCAYYYISIPVILGVLLLAGGAAGYAFYMMGRIPIKLAVIIVAGIGFTAWAVVKSLLVRARDEDPGDALQLTKHPRLRRVLDEVAGQIGTRAVDAVYITPGTDLAVMERGGMLSQLRGHSERCLILGVGVLDGMKMGPFKAILAHEYGHFSNRDTAGGGFALAVRRSIYSMAQSLAEGGAATWYNPAWLFINGFHRVFLRISQGASRLQEVLADRWAAFAYGAREFEAGLRHVIARSARFDAHTGLTLQEVVDEKRPLANFYTYRPHKELDEVEIVGAVEQAITAEPSPYDSHPSPRTRFELVHSLGATAEGDLSDAGADVWELFEDREQLQRWMTERIRANVAINHGISIPSPT